MNLLGASFFSEITVVNAFLEALMLVVAAGIALLFVLVICTLFKLYRPG